MVKKKKKAAAKKSVKKFGKKPKKATPKKTVKKAKKTPKKTARKPVKKTAKKVAKKKTAAKTATKKSSAKPAAIGKPIGEVTHFYNHIGVAIVKFNRDVPVGATVRFEGATTNFTLTIVSMQFNHAPVQTAKKGQQIGIKVPKRTRENDLVFLA